MNNQYLFLLFSFFLASCSNSNQQILMELSMDGECYSIDIDGEKDKHIPMSSYFKNVQTIILETNNDCLIGFIDELQVFDGFIYILDQRIAKNLYVFDHEGRFVRKIGSLGNGPGEYVRILDFTLDTKNRNIFLLDEMNRIYKYKFDGTYVHTITIEAPNSSTKYIQYYEGRLYASQNWWKKSDDNCMLLEIDPNNGEILSRLVSMKYNKNWDVSFTSVSGFFKSRVNSPPRYSRMFMDYIVNVGEEITPYIKLKSKHLTTEKDLENIGGKDGLPLDIQKLFSISKIFNIHCFVENEDYILFRCDGMQSSFVTTFNKKTEEVKLANNFNNDLIYNHDLQPWSGLFGFSDSKGVYEVLNTQYDFFNTFQNSIKNNEMIPNLDKLDQLKKLTSDSNPIIFFYEFK